MFLRCRAATVALLLLGGAVSGACSGVEQGVEDVRTTAQDLTTRARFCLNVTRAATALEDGNYQTAANAAQEALAQAPEELRSDARKLAEAAETVRDGNHEALDDPSLAAAAERLKDNTRSLCDPTG